MTTELIEFEGEGYLFLSGFEQSKKKEVSIDEFDSLNNMTAQEIINSVSKDSLDLKLENLQ